MRVGISHFGGVLPWRGAGAIRSPIPGHGRRATRKVAHAFAALVFLACSSAPAASPTPVLQPTSPAATPPGREPSAGATASAPTPAYLPPTPTAAFTPTPPPSAPETPATAPPEEPGPTAGASAVASDAPASGPTWTRIGRLSRAAEIVGAVGFAGGYVVAANDGETGIPTAFFSADGVNWQATALSENVANCFGDQSPDAIVHRAAASADEVLLVGTLFSYSPENCAGDEGVGGGAVGWVSSDGVNWRRTEPFGGRHSVATSAWAVPGGWEVGLTNCCDFDTVWQTTDGSWHEVLRIAGTEQSGNHVVGAAADEVRLAAAASDDGHLLMQSTDGVAWQGVDVPAELAWPQAVLAPVPNGAPTWLLAAANANEDTTILVSSDLQQWQSGELPGGRTLTAVAATSEGYVASGEYLCDIVLFFGVARHMSGCDAPRQRQYVSVDGLTWEATSPRLEGPVLITDGPHGVMLVGVDSGRVWQLAGGRDDTNP